MPEVRLSRLQAEADPENFKVWHGDFGPPAHSTAERETYIALHSIRERLTKAVEAPEVLAKAVAALKDAEADPDWRWDKPGNLCEVRDVFLEAALQAAFPKEESE